MIDMYLIEPCVFSPLDIHFQRVTYHDRVFPSGACLLQCIGKDLRPWLQAAGTFRSDHHRKIGGKSGILQLAMLGFFEAIGYKVQFISFLLQLIEQLDSMRK